jgi:hypothetical protein
MKTLKKDLIINALKVILKKENRAFILYNDGAYLIGCGLALIKATNNNDIAIISDYLKRILTPNDNLIKISKDTAFNTMSDDAKNDLLNSIKKVYNDAENGNLILKATKKATLRLKSVYRHFISDDGYYTLIDNDYFKSDFIDNYFYDMQVKTIFNSDKDDKNIKRPIMITYSDLNIIYAPVSDRD